MGVPVGVGMAVAAPRARDHLHPALLHAAHGQDSLRHRLQPVRLALHDDHLQAEIVREVDVQRGAHAVAELVLHLRQLLAEVAHVVIVDERERADGAHALLHLGPPDLGPRQIAEQLRARAPALAREGVHLLEQGALDSNAEPDERILHARKLSQGCRAVQGGALRRA
jgi:hypothetical protein